LPESVGYDEGSLFEPLGVAVHAIERVGITPGDTVLVMGAGPIGIFAQQVAKASGAKVIAAELKQFRFDLAKKIGSADVYVNTEKEDVVKRTMELTNGRGADVVVELAGAPITTVQSFQAVRKCGRVVLVGLSEKPVQIEPTSMIIYKEATVFGSTGRAMFGTWERMVNLVGNKLVKPGGVITDRLRLDQAEDGFQRVIRGESGKVLFTPN
jgi:threonine 3-dehydrogenase